MRFLYSCWDVNQLCTLALFPSPAPSRQENKEGPMNRAVMKIMLLHFYLLWDLEAQTQALEGSVLAEYSLWLHQPLCLLSACYGSSSRLAVVGTLRRINLAPCLKAALSLAQNTE